jgi:transcription initiation factor TFIID TATA-box-binding protein
MCGHTGSFVYGLFKYCVAEHRTGTTKMSARCFSCPAHSLGATTGNLIILQSLDSRRCTYPVSITPMLIGLPITPLPCKSYPHYQYPLPSWIGFVFSQPKTGWGKLCTGSSGRGIGNLAWGSPDSLKLQRKRKKLTQLFKYCFVAFINMKVRPEDSLKIENIVASAKVTDYLDLPMLASKIDGAEYNKKRFPGVVLRMQDPKIAALVFGSGKVVLTGAKSVNSLSKGLNILGDKLRELGIDIPKKLEYKIQNIVTSADLATPINLNKIAVGFNLDKIEYEPEQFPGLVYRLDVPKVVVLLFGSGKLIITGGKEPDDAKKAVVKILSDLRSLGLIS